MKTSIETNVTISESSRAPGLPAPPQAICDWLARLAGEENSSHLVGECVLQLALDLTPTHFRARSSISREKLLRLAPRAIPTGVHSGAITIPTSAGPLDVTPEQSANTLPCDPAASSLPILGLAFDPIRAQLIAPPRALDDIASRRLNPSDDAMPSNDPAFALEAARLVATYGLSATASLLDCARKTRFEVTPHTRSRMRRLLREILLSPHPRAGLGLLRDSGAETALVSGVRACAPTLVSRVPPQLRVRLLAWLLGADAKSLLRTLHFGGQFSADVYRLLEHHPIEGCVAPKHDGEVRKLLRRLSQSEIEDLLIVRHAEAERLRDTDQSLEADRIALALERLTQAFARVREKQRLRERRAQLAISGAEIMQILGCEPGPVVGRAIRHLERCVEAKPESNSPDALLAELDRWWDNR